MSMVLVCGACSKPVSEAPLDTLLASGWNDYRMGEYDRAIHAFEQMIARTSENQPGHMAALYGLATTWNLRMPAGAQDKDKALALYDHIIALSPGSDLAGWSLLAKARILHLVPVGQDPDYEAVRRAYADTYRAFPDAYPGQEAFVYMEATHIAEWTPDAAHKAADALETFIRRHPDSDLLGSAYSLLATCYEILGQPRKRLDAMVAAAQNRVIDPDSPLQENSWLYWQIATVAEFEVGAFDTARFYYKQLLKEYPRDIRRYGVETALRRMDELEARLRQEIRTTGSL